MNAEMGSPWAIGIGVVAVVAIGRWGIWWWHTRKVEAPLTEQWRASHDYSKGGDDRQWK